MENHNLEKAIISTICYFDVFDRPLTLLEIQRWLLIGGQNLFPVDLSAIKTALDSSPYLSRKIKCQNGFYFLTGREATVAVRLNRYNIAEPKFKKIWLISKILSFFPYIKMIAVANTLSYSNSRPEGDLDLFIITAKNKVWPARFWILLFLTIFHLRPTVKKTQDRICASFFIDESQLDLKKIAIADPDSYLIFWIKQLFPIFGHDLYENFLTANAWVGSYLPQPYPIKSFRRNINSDYSMIKFWWEKISNFLPLGFYRATQSWLMPLNLKKMANCDTCVVINDRILKFHKNDRRKLYNRLFEKNLAKNL